MSQPEELSSSPPLSSALFSDEAIDKVGRTLADEGAPLAERFRAVFTLRNIPNSQRAIDALIAGMKSDSALLKHEIAYVLGQIGDPYSVPFLSTVLANTEEDTMVRHEAGEALG